MKKSTPILALTLAGLLAACGVPTLSSGATSASLGSSSGAAATSNTGTRSSGNVSVSTDISVSTDHPVSTDPSVSSGVSVLTSLLPAVTVEVAKPADPTAAKKSAEETKNIASAIVKATAASSFAYPDVVTVVFQGSRNDGSSTYTETRSIKGVYNYTRQQEHSATGGTRDMAEFYFSQNGKNYYVADLDGAVSVTEFSEADFKTALATYEAKDIVTLTSGFAYSSLQQTIGSTSAGFQKKAEAGAPTITSFTGYSDAAGFLTVQFIGASSEYSCNGDLRFESNLPTLLYSKQTALTTSGAAMKEAASSSDSQTLENFNWGHVEVIQPDMSVVKPTSSVPATSSGSETSSSESSSVPTPPSIFEEVNPLDLPCGLGSTAMAQADTLAKAQAFDTELQSATPTSGEFSYHQVERIIGIDGHEYDSYNETRIVPGVFGCSIQEDSEFSESSDLEMVYAKNGEYFRLSNYAIKGESTRHREYWKITKAEFDEEMANTYPTSSSGDRQTKRDEINQYGVSAFSKYFLAILTGDNTSVLNGDQKYTLDTTALGSLYAMETSLKASNDPEAPDDPWTGHEDYTIRFLGTDCASYRTSTTKNYTSGGTYVHTYEYSLENGNAYPFYPNLDNYTLQTA